MTIRQSGTPTMSIYYFIIRLDIYYVSRSISIKEANMIDKWKRCDNTHITCDELVTDMSKYGLMWGDPAPGVTEKDLDYCGNVLNIMSVEDIVNMKRLTIRELHPEKDPKAVEILCDFCVCNWIDLENHVLELKTDK